MTRKFAVILSLALMPASSMALPQLQRPPDAARAAAAAALARSITKGSSKLGYGNACILGASGVSTCGSIGAVEIVNVYDGAGGLTSYSFVFGSENIVGGRNDGSYRSFQCPLLGASYVFTASGATLSVSVDTSAPDCQHWGQLFDNEMGTAFDWRFTGTIPVSAQWYQARYTARTLSSGVQADSKVNSQRRFTCQLVQGDSAAGSFSFGSNVYVMVSGPDLPDLVGSGTHSQQTCIEALK